MQKYLLLFSLLLNTHIIMCQKIQYGIGIGFGGYFFNHDNKHRFDNDVLKPVGSVSGGVLGYVNFFSDYKFQVRSSVHLTTNKPIVFAATVKDANNVATRSAMTFNFVSMDFNLLGLYQIKLKKSQLRPFLGIFYAHNIFLDVSFSESKNVWTRTSPNSLSTGTPVSPTDLEVTRESPSNYLGINAGFFWQPNGSKFEVFTIAYLSPMKFFSEPFEYRSVNQVGYLQGRYQYFDVGVNYRLSKERKK